MKKYFSGLITGLLLAFAITGFAATPIKDAFFTNEIKFKVDGKASDVTFVNVDGSNYGKVRDIVNAMGGTTDWDEANQTINASTANTTENKEVSSMPTATTGIDLTQWITFSDLGSKYSIKCTYTANDIISIENLNKKFTFSSLKIPKEEGAINTVTTELGSLSILFYDGRTYLSLTDLQKLGIIP